MSKIPVDLNSVEAIDREIARLDDQLKEYHSINQRRADFVALRALAQRLRGIPVTAQATTNNGNNQQGDTVAAIAFRALAARGGLSISGLLAAMHQEGWAGSGNDAKDKKRLYSAIYKKPQFKLEDGIWEVV